LIFFASLSGIDPAIVDARVADLVEKCALEEVKHTKAGVLSEGYLRRLTLAMALIGRPKVVILDDPFLGVDPITILKLKRVIKEETKGLTLLFFTQFSNHAEDLGTSMAILHQGRLIANGSVNDVMRRHGQGYTVEVQLSLEQLFASYVPKVGRERFPLYLTDHETAAEALSFM